MIDAIQEQCEGIEIIIQAVTRSRNSFAGSARSPSRNERL